MGYDRGYDAPGLGGRRQGLTPVMSSMEGGPNGDATVPSVAPRKSVFAGNPQDGFVQRFRDGDKPPIRHGDEAQSGPAAKPLGGSSEAAIALLPKGLQIAMKLLDPVATGSKSRARIRVTADALDSSGKVLVLNGTEGDLPFAAGEILGGRVILNDSEKGVLRVNGQEVPITGSIRDKDGRVGLKGEIKKSGGSGVLGRTLGAVGRTASGIAMRSGLPVYDVESAIGLPGGTGVQYGSSREVVVKKDAQFTFIVGQ